MKKILLLSTLFLIASCSGIKQTRTYLTAGNYDEAINKSINNLRSDKNKKGNQDYVYILEEAYAKAKERDSNSINMLLEEKNPANLEKIYTTYLELYDRQEKIKPLLPLKLIIEARDAQFPFENYNEKIVTAKNNLSTYLYGNAKLLLKKNDKMSSRKAYDDLIFLNKIYPSYKDVATLTNEAHQKGTDYVIIYTKNETNLVIPKRLENDLLDFSTYGLNDIWTIYHSNKQKGIPYDYGIQIIFREINVSPEQIKEKEFIKEKEVKEGQKTLIDINGKPVLDKEGKVILVDNMKKVSIQIYESRQFKSCQVTANINYVNNSNNQLMQSFPLSSEFVFENIYSTYKGDRRASDDTYFSYFDKKSVPFPTNEQMIYDTGKDLKLKLKEIISQNNIRKQ